jgi:hypothetical protein
LALSDERQPHRVCNETQICITKKELISLPQSSL